MAISDLTPQLMDRGLCVTEKVVVVVVVVVVCLFVLVCVCVCGGGGSAYVCVCGGYVPCIGFNL